MEKEQITNVLQKMGEDILAQIPLAKSNNSIEELANKTKRLQKFLDVFPDKASQKTNQYLEEYQSEFGEDGLEEYREKLIEISKKVIVYFGNKLLG